MVVGGPLAGYWRDRFGRRVALIACVVIFGLATIGTAFCPWTCGLTPEAASGRGETHAGVWAARRHAGVNHSTRKGTYWYALATAMVCAFAGCLAWVRSHYPAIGKPDAIGATAS